MWLQDSSWEDVEGGENEDGTSEELRDEDFQEYDLETFDAKTLELLSRGWTAFIVGVMLPA